MHVRLTASLAGSVAVLVLLALLMAPPATAQSTTVNDLNGQESGATLNLTWTHRDPTWVNYEVWRTASPYAGVTDAASVKLATVPAGALNGTMSYAVTDSGTGSVTTNRSYVVRGVSGAGAFSSLSNRAGEFDFSLRGGHKGITQYEGPQTCVACHATEANEALHSEHMKWEGKWPQVNTYCTAPQFSEWACLNCHVSTGKPMNQTVNQVDCLVCHNDTYQRSLQPMNVPLTVTDWQGTVKTYNTPAKNADGNYEMKPNFAAMPAGTTMEQLAQNVHLPTRATCLRCHAKSGGGDGVKRGDLSTVDISPTVNSDVHMSQQGGNFTCQTCHVMRDHQIPGRGIDLQIYEGAKVKACADCHSSTPHGNADINKHTDRVACQTCHISHFAKDMPTEMSRDWRVPKWNPAGLGGQGAWIGEEVKAGNQLPQYTFWNGGSYVYDVGNPIAAGTDGKYALAYALGDINGAGSKLYPIKVHEAWQPRHDGTGLIVQYDVYWNFLTGKYDEAAARGVAAMGLTGSHTWVNTKVQQLITHGVEPKANAVPCAACHETRTQVDLRTLGYVLKGPESQVCTQCHRQQKNPGFYQVHNIHVDDEGINCSKCHNFSRP